MTRYSLLVLILFSSLLLHSAGQQQPAFLQPGQALDQQSQQWVEHTLGSMTTEEKVGQVIVAGTPTGFTSLNSERFREIRKNVSEYHVGGYLAFGGEVLSAAYLVKRMQDQARIPLLITADLEGGAGLILRGATRFPKAMAIGATQDPDSAYQVGRITGAEARAIGINVNFYPVVDVNNNPRNPIINIRSFGEDPARVGEMAAAYIRGIQENGVMATAKHFPGHGDTATDSHLELPVIQATRERLETVELPPFRKAIASGVGGIMTAHLFIPALEQTPGLPATLSRSILSGLLRDQLHFDGLIFTDAMNMAGIVKKYKNEEAAVLALNAGADVILYPPSVGDAFAGLLAGVRSGAVKEERLTQAVRRILETKARLGLNRSGGTDLTRIDELVASDQNQAAAQNIMDRAVTLVRDEKKILPFAKISSDKDVLVITVLDQRSTTDLRGNVFVQNLRQRLPGITSYEVLPSTSPAEMRLLRELGRRADYLIVGTYIRVADSKGSIDLAPAQVELLKALARLGNPVAFVLFGSPYLLAAVPELPSYILTFEDYPGAELAAAKAIVGEIPFRGKLPVTLPDFYPAGYGITK